jgi:hypothetical protein
LKKYQSIFDEVSENLKLKGKIDDHDEKYKFVLDNSNPNYYSKNEFYERVFNLTFFYSFLIIIKVFFIFNVGK